MPNESGQVNSPETENPARSRLSSAGEFHSKIEAILDGTYLTRDESDAVIGAVELMAFASQYLPKECTAEEDAAEPDASESLCHVTANYEAVEVDGRIRFIPNYRNKPNGSTQIDPLLVRSVLAIENLFNADLSNQFHTVKAISEYGVYGDSFFQKALKYVDDYFWTPEKSVAGRSRKAYLDGKKLKQIEQSIHLRQNSLKHVEALKISLAEGFDPVEFHNLVFKINTYLLNLLVERYGKG